MRCRSSWRNAGTRSQPLVSLRSASRRPWWRWCRRMRKPWDWFLKLIHSFSGLAILSTVSAAATVIRSAKWIQMFAFNCYIVCDWFNYVWCRLQSFNTVDWAFEESSTAPPFFCGTTENIFVYSAPMQCHNAAPKINPGWLKSSVTTHFHWTLLMVSTGQFSWGLQKPY